MPTKELKIIVEGNRVTLNKGTEVIGLDITGNDVHVWATDKHGGRTVAKLRFAKDEVEELKK